MSITGKLIRQALNDQQVHVLDQKYFPKPWTESQWKELRPDQHLLFTWVIGEAVMGYALFHYLEGDDTAHLYKILLIPNLRNSGEALAFWSVIVGELRLLKVKSVYLEVESSNESAKRFYQKCGFALLRRSKAYYSNGEDGLMMELML